MSDKQSSPDRADGETDGAGPPVDRRTVLSSVGVAVTPLTAAGGLSTGRGSTVGEWYGYGDEEYGFAGYGGVPASSD